MPLMTQRRREMLGHRLVGRIGGLYGDLLRPKPFLHIALVFLKCLVAYEYAWRKVCCFVSSIAKAAKGWLVRAVATDVIRNGRIATSGVSPRPFLANILALPGAGNKASTARIADTARRVPGLPVNKPLLAGAVEIIVLVVVGILAPIESLLSNSDLVLSHLCVLSEIIASVHPLYHNRGVQSIGGIMPASFCGLGFAMHREGQ